MIPGIEMVAKSVVSKKSTCLLFDVLRVLGVRAVLGVWRKPEHVIRFVLGRDKAIHGSALMFVLRNCQQCEHKMSLREKSTHRITTRPRLFAL